jgi:hypothetical protein
LARVNLKRGEGVEKMATIRNVVNKWNRSNPENEAGKPKKGSFYGRSGEEAVIKLSDNPRISHIKSWSDRTCYVFGFNYYGQTKNPIKIEISFERRIKEHSNTQAFYEFLRKIINDNEELKEFILSKGRINPNHLVLKRVFPPNSPEQDICDCMDELIKLTKVPICKFLANKKNKKLLTEREEKMFSKILGEHKIKDNKLSGKCKKIYTQTIKILRCISAGSEYPDELKTPCRSKDYYTEVSYYTKKSIAQKLLIASKAENKYGEMRSYYTHGMNDPSEGKTLLQFLGIIEKKDLKLPEPLPFITCFSLEVNSLNQFRLYGKDNNEEATGVSIVFKPSFFNKVRELYRCVYIDPDNKQIKTISFSKKEEDEEKEKEKEKKKEEKWIENKQNEVKGLFEELKKKIKVLLKEEIQDKHELAKDLLINIRYLVKDYAFMEERECRIIDTRNKEEKESIDIDDGRLYITIDEIKDHVDRIYFGPLAEGIEGFRLKIKEDIECIPSRHPYKYKRQ